LNDSDALKGSLAAKHKAVKLQTAQGLNVTLIGLNRTNGLQA